MPRGRLASADLFGQGDDEARGAAEVAEPEARRRATVSSTANMTRRRPSVPCRAGPPCPAAASSRGRGRRAARSRTAKAQIGPRQADLDMTAGEDLAVGRGGDFGIRGGEGGSRARAV